LIEKRERKREREREALLFAAVALSRDFLDCHPRHINQDSASAQTRAHFSRSPRTPRILSRPDLIRVGEKQRTAERERETEDKTEKHERNRDKLAAEYAFVYRCSSGNGYQPAAGRARRPFLIIHRRWQRRNRKGEGLIEMISARRARDKESGDGRRNEEEKVRETKEAKVERQRNEERERGGRGRGAEGGTKEAPRTK